MATYTQVSSHSTVSNVGDNEPQELDMASFLNDRNNFEDFAHEDSRVFYPEQFGFLKVYEHQDEHQQTTTS